MSYEDDLRAAEMSQRVSLEKWATPPGMMFSIVTPQDASGFPYALIKRIGLTDTEGKDATVSIFFDDGAYSIKATKPKAKELYSALLENSAKSIETGSGKDYSLIIQKM